MPNADSASHRQALKDALATLDETERYHAVARATQSALEAAGLSEVQARWALVILGYQPSLQLIDLYQSAWFSAKLHKDAGTFKNGTMTSIYAWCADVWSRESGDPGYTPEKFKAAYLYWARKSGAHMPGPGSPGEKGGGLSRQYRSGFEKTKKVVKSRP